MGTLPNSSLSKTEKQDYKNRKGPTHTCCLIQHFANLPSSLINQVLSKVSMRSKHLSTSTHWSMPNLTRVSNSITRCDHQVNPGHFEHDKTLWRHHPCHANFLGQGPHKPFPPKAVNILVDTHKMPLYFSEHMFKIYVASLTSPPFVARMLGDQYDLFHSILAQISNGAHGISQSFGALHVPNFHNF